jgi:hypothetical protein
MYKLLIPFEFLTAMIILLIEIPLVLLGLLVSIFELPRYLHMRRM